MITPDEESTEISYIGNSIIINVRTYQTEQWGNEEIKYFLHTANHVPVIFFEFNNRENDFFIHLNFTNAAETSFDILEEQLEIILLNTLIGTNDLAIIEKHILLSKEDTEVIEICFANQTGHTYNFIERSIDFIYHQNVVLNAHQPAIHF